MTYSDESLLSSLDIQGWNLKSFAQELFENTGQLISLAKIQLASINPEKGEETINIIKSSDRILGRVIKNLRNLARQLSPSDILQKGFISSLEYELERISQLELWKLDLHITGKTFRMDSQWELILFSIIQHYLMDALYIENAKKFEVAIDFSLTMMKISLFYPLNPELLMAKKSRTGMGVPQRAAYIGAVISSKRKSNSREVSICLKK